MAMSSKCLFVFGFLSVAMTTLAATMSLSECKEKAADGDAEALWQLGQRYENGDGIRKDGLKAVSQYRKAAEKNHAKACGRLAELYATGKIVGKDPVKAARYRAQAKGDSGEMAAALAQTAQERSKVDYIEVALDYIIGRNGQQRDAKKGIQLLYKTAKDNPTAQRVFVDRWEKGDLDEGLGILDADDWNLVLPWFKAQYEKGRRKGGMVLGNEAYRNKRYDEAVRYWQASAEAGLPKSWFLLGKFYCYDEENGGGPKSMRSDIKAKKAFERCLKLDATWTDARINIGFLCVFGDEKCADYPRAMSIFSAAMRNNPNDERFPYWYGCAGRNEAWRKLNSHWKDNRVKYLWAQNDKKALTNSEYNELKRFVDEVKQCEAEEEKYMQYVLRSANKGHEPAQECYRKWAEKHGRSAVFEQNSRSKNDQSTGNVGLKTLCQKWPRAVERISCWEMPQFAKRFHEIDYYQDNKWDKNSAESLSVFEKLVRGAIAMKIEPAGWYYNLACVLSLQNRKDESLDALEQAIVAGFYKVKAASKDSDFANIRNDPRFAQLLKVMSENKNYPTDSPRSLAVPRNGTLLLTEANSYFVFTHYAFYSVLKSDAATQPLYVDMEGLSNAPVGIIELSMNKPQNVLTSVLAWQNIISNAKGSACRLSFEESMNNNK